MGSIGVQEMLFIFLVALLIFGPRKLPELGRALGKALTEFRRASAEVRLAVEEEMRELDRQAREAAREAERAVLDAQTAETPQPTGSGPAPHPEPASSPSATRSGEPAKSA